MFSPLLVVPRLIVPFTVSVPWNRRNALAFVTKSRLALTTELTKSLPPLLVTTTDEGAGPLPCLVPALTVKLLIVPPLRVKTLFTVSRLAAFALLPLNTPPLRVKAPLLKKLLTVVLWPRVMAAVLLLLRASSVAVGVLPLLQCDGESNQSPGKPFQVIGPGIDPACAGWKDARPSESRAAAMLVLRRRLPRPRSRRRMVMRAGRAGAAV